MSLYFVSKSGVFYAHAFSVTSATPLVEYTNILSIKVYSIFDGATYHYTSSHFHVKSTNFIAIWT
jgi:hypothetical protein